MSSTEQIGVFGGSFNPPHVGHLIVAEAARVQLGLDRVLWVPNNVPPHKDLDGGATNADREAMVKATIDGNPYFELSEIELNRKGLSFMVDTLDELSAEYPSASLWLIIGMDSLVSFGRWRNPDQIVDLAKLAVYPRTGFSLEDADSSYRAAATLLDAPIVDVSSTKIRARVRGGSVNRYEMPQSVFHFLSDQNLYANEARSR